MAAHQLALASIRTDGGTQSRAEINMVCVEEYAADMEAGADFPPVVVFYDGTDHWLADGFHRVEAVRQLDKKKINADVRQGTVRDAILFSLGANGNHGLRRTNTDKRRAVLVLLGDDEWRKKSDRWIAKACGVSADFSSRMRREQVSSNDTSTESRTGMDGKEYPFKPRPCPPPVEDHAEQDDEPEGDREQEPDDATEPPRRDDSPKTTSLWDKISDHIGGVVRIVDQLAAQSAASNCKQHVAVRDAAQELTNSVKAFRRKVSN